MDRSPARKVERPISLFIARRIRAVVTAPNLAAVSNVLLVRAPAALRRQSWFFPIRFELEVPVHLGQVLPPPSVRAIVSLSLEKSRNGKRRQSESAHHWFHRSTV